ncbi:MAG: FG-GAP-like repeat-containing protein [bacterium]
MFTKLKQFHPNTDLTNTQIVVPEDQCYREAAEEIRSRIYELFAINVPIKTDKTFGQKYVAKRNLILLGDVNTNRAFFSLYAQRYCAADARYPGKGGYALHTIHDPWGNGCNAIAVSASDIDSTNCAAKRFCEILRGSSPSPVIQPIFEIKLGPSAYEIPGISEEPSVKEVVAKVSDYAKKGGHTGPWRDIAQYGTLYTLTGKAVFAQIMKQLLFFAQEHADSGHGNYGGSWGFDADFVLQDVIPAWDVVEECDIFTPEERLRISRILIRYIESCPSHIENLDERRLRHNHSTHAAIGLYIAGLYFWKYYRLPRAKKWMQLAEKCFFPHLGAFITGEDASSYQWCVHQHVTRYSFLSGDMTFFESDNARKVADYAIMITDNLGAQVAFGDTSGRGGSVNEMFFLGAAAFWYQDERYQWLIEKKKRTCGVVDNAFEFHRSISPVIPVDLDGVKTFPMDPLFYQWYVHKTPSNKYVRKTLGKKNKFFDKLSFRDGFDPQGQYLLLDGINTGSHKHFDGNSILQLTQLGKTWLFDGDYVEKEQKYHNTVLISQDGRSDSLPDFAELKHVRGFRRTGFSQSAMHKIAGTDWHRNIFWKRGDYFLVADEIKAHTSDIYSIKIVWQTMGEPEPKRDKITLTQDREQFCMHWCSSPQVKLVKRSSLDLRGHSVAGKNDRRYTLYQTSDVRLEKGARFIQWNLLAGKQAQKASSRLKQVTSECVRVSIGKDVIFAGLGNDKKAISIPDGPVVSASMFQVSPIWYALIAGTNLFWDRELFSSDKPVDIEFDLQRNSGTIQTNEKTQIYMTGAKTSAAELDGKQIQPSWKDGKISFTVPSGSHTIAIIPGELLKRQRASTTLVPYSRIKVPYIRFGKKGALPPMRKVWEYKEGTELVSLAVADLNGDGYNEFVIGGASKNITALDHSGKKLWQFSTGGTVRSLWAGDMGNGAIRIAAGSADTKLYVLDSFGKKLWDWQAPYHSTVPQISAVTAGDINSDGKTEIVCGSDNWYVYAFTGQGKELWRFQGVHNVLSLFLADCDGKGTMDTISGACGGIEYCITHEGKKKWHYTTGLPQCSVAAGDLDGTGRQIPIFGAEDGIHVIDRHETKYANSNHYAHGLPRFSYNTGDLVCHVICADVNGDGKDEIIAGSEGGNVYVLRGDGQRIWRTYLENPVRKVAVGDFNGDKNIEIAVGTDNGVYILSNKKGEIMAHYATQTPVTNLAPCFVSSQDIPELLLTTVKGIVSVVALP